MGITYTNKETSVQRIDCGGTFRVTLSLTAEPSIVSNPCDIVLILDRSRSMAGRSFDNLKEGAKTFIDIIDEATDGAKDGQIGGGSRIGIVSFADTARVDEPLITSVSALKAAVDGLTADGSTNHEDAFTKALALFDPASTNEKIMVMFTDGRTTAGGDANVIATAAKAQGVIIYVIGLSGNGGIDEQALRDWASDPDSAYVAITPDDEDLEELFEDLARNITKPGATDIVIRDRVASCFTIIDVDDPTKGKAEQKDDRTVEWKIDKLGVSGSEGASLTFTVRHTGSCTGSVEVNEFTTYEDHEDNDVTFPSPRITVVCDDDLCVEGCPDAVNLEIEGCEDSVVLDAGELVPESLGRVVELRVKLKNICPHRRVALAAILTELDDYGNEFKRGLKTIAVPAHDHPTCRDIEVRCIRFVLPESLDVSGSPNAICNKRRLRARFIVHYIDNDFECPGMTL
ncbi:MAG: VWA domain-containing protein [Clostridia bacterium]|nr:VWA domain-containing protein [Clostridia bacterium]